MLVIVKQENRNAHWRHVWARKHQPHKRQMDCGQMRLRCNASTLVFMVRDPYRFSASACAMAPCVMGLPRKPNTAPECSWHKFTPLFSIVEKVHTLEVCLRSRVTNNVTLFALLQIKENIMMKTLQYLFIRKIKSPNAETSACTIHKFLVLTLLEAF